RDGALFRFRICGRDNSCSCVDWLTQTRPRTLLVHGGVARNQHDTGSRKKPSIHEPNCRLPSRRQFSSISVETIVFQRVLPVVVGGQGRTGLYQRRRSADTTYGGLVAVASIHRVSLPERATDTAVRCSVRKRGVGGAGIRRVENGITSRSRAYCAAVHVVHGAPIQASDGTEYSSGCRCWNITCECAGQLSPCRARGLFPAAHIFAAGGEHADRTRR